MITGGTTMKNKQFLLKVTALFVVFALSATLFANTLMSFAAATVKSVTLSSDASAGTEWVLDAIETNYSFNLNATTQETGTVYTIKSSVSGLYLTAAFDASGTATLTTEERNADNPGQRWMFRVPWNAPPTDPNYNALSYALINLGYTYDVSGVQVPAMLKTNLTTKKLTNDGNGSGMWCIDGGLGVKFPSGMTTYTTKLFGASPEKYLSEEAEAQAEPYTKLNDVELIGTGKLTDWVFEKAGTESYKDYQGTVRADQQLYTIKSKTSGAYLTAVYAEDGSVTIETGSRDTSDKGQLWSLYRHSDWAPFYNLINFGRMQDVTVGNDTVSVPTQIETTSGAVTTRAPHEDGTGSKSWFLNGAQNSIESLITAQGTTDGSFTATLATQWPILYFSEVVTEAGRTAEVLIKSTKASDFTTSVVDNNDAYTWDVVYQSTENNKDYYTVYHRGTGLYLSIRSGKPVLAERDEFDTTQLWYFRDCSTYGNQLAGWNYVYEIRSYDNTKAIHTVESNGVALEETELKFTDTASLGEAGGRGWTLQKSRAATALAKNNVCVINSYQWGKGGNYYLYAPIYRPLQSISLDKTELKLTPGKTDKLTLALNPTDTTDTVQPVWSSDNEASVSVDQDGNVTANKFGTATITVTAGGKTATCTVTVENINVNAVELDRDKLSLTAGSSFTLSAEILPEGVTQQYTVSWSSDNSDVATVDNNGKVTAVKAGAAIITCKVETASGSFTDTCEIDVPVKGITSVSLSKEKLNVIIGETGKLDYSVAPDDNTAQNIQAVFSSDNTDVVTVDNDGNINAIGIGKAIITVTVNELYTDTCEISVVHREVEKLTINKKSLKLVSGQTADLSVEIFPENTTVDKDVLWSSSRPAVAMVTGGKVTAIKPGTAEITAKVGNASVTCKVTVTSVNKTEEYVTWQGTLLDSDGNALANHQITVGDKTAYTDKNGEFTLSDLTVGAITAEVRNADGELLLSKALMIEKGSEDAINGSIVTVSGDVMRLSLKLNGATADITTYETAKDHEGAKSPSTGDSAMLMLSALFMLASFALLLCTLFKAAAMNRKSSRV